MEKKTQIAILLENSTGELAKIFRLMARAKVNIEALTLDDGVHHGILKMIVDKPERAHKALKKIGIPCSEQQVLAVPVPNKPGALAEICGKLAKKKLNISYLYGSTCNCGGEGQCDCACSCICILHVPDGKTIKGLLK